MLFPPERIGLEVARLAGEISRDYAGKELHVVIVLKGAFIFAADLVRRLTVPVAMDFIEISSYCGMTSTGSATITRDAAVGIGGRHVLVIEDIIDEGRSISFLLDRLRLDRPASLAVCTLIDNRRRRIFAIEPDYAGIRCTCGFLVGYGLDMDQRFRELPALYEVVHA
jgi:hypoxanthine phosphoribosyltransferase